MQEDISLDKLFANFLSQKKDCTNVNTFKKIVSDYNEWILKFFECESSVKNIDSNRIRDFLVFLIIENPGYRVYPIKLSLQAILEFGVETGVINDNPCKEVSVPECCKPNKHSKPKRALNILDKGQLKLLVDAMLKLPCRRFQLLSSTLVYLAIKTKLYIGDVASIKWCNFKCKSEDIDWKSNQLADNNYKDVVLTARGISIDIEPLGAKILDTAAKSLKEEFLMDDSVYFHYRTSTFSQWLKFLSSDAELPEISADSLRRMGDACYDVFTCFNVSGAYRLLTPKPKRTRKSK